MSFIYCVTTSKKKKEKRLCHLISCSFMKKFELLLFIMFWLLPAQWGKMYNVLQRFPKFMAPG